MASRAMVVLGRARGRRGRSLGVHAGVIVSGDEPIFLYRQHSKYENAVDMGRCRASVSRGRASLGQCVRNRKRDVSGFGFCEQHAREAEVKLGLREPPKRPPTRFERELAAMADRHNEREAMREMLDRLATALESGKLVSGGIEGVDEIGMADDIRRVLNRAK